MVQRGAQWVVYKSFHKICREINVWNFWTNHPANNNIENVLPQAFNEKKNNFFNRLTQKWTSIAVFNHDNVIMKWKCKNLIKKYYHLHIWRRNLIAMPCCYCFGNLVMSCHIPLPPLSLTHILHQFLFPYSKFHNVHKPTSVPDRKHFAHI